MSGTFRLAFNGETTPFINAAATAEELRSALEALDSITTAAVSRDFSVMAIGGESGAGDLDLTFGSLSAECSIGEDACVRRCHRTKGRVAENTRRSESQQCDTGCFLFETYFFCVLQNIKKTPIS